DEKRRGRANGAAPTRRVSRGCDGLLFRGRGAFFVGRGVVGGFAALVEGVAALFFEAAEGAALVWVLVLDDAVDFASFVPFRQVLCDRKTFRITEKHSMAVFVLLHLVAGADPRAAGRFFRLVLVEVAGAQRLADLVDVLGEADDEKLRDLALRMQV